MAVAFLIEHSAAAYNMPALLGLALVIFSCVSCLVALAIIKVINNPNIEVSWTTIVDYGLVVRLSLLEAALSLRSAFEAAATLLLQWGRPPEHHELRSWPSLNMDSTAREVCPTDQAFDRLSFRSFDGSTASGGHSAGHPNSLNDPSRSNSPAAAKDGFADAAETPSVLDADALPWASFVAPWDLIAASATPRVSSDLEGATGHTEGHSSVDVTDARV